MHKTFGISDRMGYSLKILEAILSCDAEDMGERIGKRQWRSDKIESSKPLISGVR
jgi:hypothetical protein